MSAKRKTKERLFQCPTCGFKWPAAKSASRLTSVGHIKTMWCVQCKTEKNFIQIKY